MVDVSLEMAVLALAGSFALLVVLTFIAAVACLFAVLGLRRRVRALAGEVAEMRATVRDLEEAAQRHSANSAAAADAVPAALDRHEKRLLTRLKELEGAVQQLRVEVVEQQTAKFQTNEAIRRAMASSRGPG